MIFFLNENNDLKNRNFPLPDGVRRILKNTLKQYNGDKTIDGYKRLNNILGMKNISYHEMKRIKNFFDNYHGTNKSAEFILNGGDAMKTWVNNTLYTATKAIRDFKQAKKDAGIKNAFIRHHEKDRQNKKKNKPTQVKFKSKDVGRKLFNNDSMKYESVLRESIDIYDYMDDYGVDYVLNSFLHAKKGSTQNWGVLINPSMYQKALGEFVKFGRLYKFPSNYVYQWMGIIIRNTCTLAANTQLAGHDTNYPYEEIEDFAISYLGDKFYDLKSNNLLIKITENEFIKFCEERGIYLTEANGVHKNGQYDLFMNQEEVDKYDKELEGYHITKRYQQYEKMAEEYSNKPNRRHQNARMKLGVNVQERVIYKIIHIIDFLEETGLYYWMKLPDGSDAWSDYGLKPIFNLINQYDKNMTPEQVLVLINKILDVYHQRGDLSSIFIKGGSKILSQISDTMSENKIIVISEKQKKMISEAMDNVFSFEELSSINSFRGRLNYCVKHLGFYIGKGSSRVVFQIDDEKVLKLALNQKGIAQNSQERQTYDDDIFPKIFKSDENDLWIVSEYVLPAKSSDFKHCFGMTFRKFVSFIESCKHYRYGNKSWDMLPEDEWINYIENNEYLATFDEYIGNEGSIVVGDMERISNYGLAKRYGEAVVVLLDSGFNEEIWNRFYKRR